MTHVSTRSTRFLTALSTVLLVVAVSFGAFLLVGALFGFGPGGHEVVVQSQVEPKSVVDLGPHAVLPQTLDVAVRIPDASRAQIGWAAARDLVPILVMVGGLWLVRGLLRSVRAGDPFAEVNVTRLRGLAALLLVAVPVAVFLGSIFGGELASSAGLTHPGTTVSIPGGAFLAGLAVLVLAEIFAVGVRLRSDLEGTV